ncbi:MAG: gliding motility-associated-like protein [Candidatus Azotimanducaceae bacterium]|jgi:gliding motility-associated-like protein
MNPTFRKFLLCLALVLSSIYSNASHIVGGEIYYTHTAGNTYKITLIVYQDCASSANVSSPAIIAYPLDGSATTTATGSTIFDGNVSTVYVPNPCLQPPASVCLRKKIFETNMNLPIGKGGYDVAFEDFARSANIDNLNLPDQWSSIYYCVVPDVTPRNNCPYFPNDPPPNLCLNDTFRYDHSVVDFDGDSIVYKWCNPKGNIGASAGGGTPYPNVPWCCGYGTNNPVASAPPFTIDPATGLMEGLPNVNGNFVYSVCYEEYRNGVKINEGARDYMFRVTSCSPRVPVVGSVAQGGASSLGFCSDMQVSFVNTSSNAEHYYWDFGDTLITTDTSTQKEPTYTYNQAGDYEIMLIANPGTDCSDTTYLNYEVYPEIDVFFIPPSPVCFYGGEFDFELLGKFDSLNDDFLWDFGTVGVNQYSNEVNPSNVMFSEPGFHVVTVTVTSPSCNSTYSEIVEVLDSPDPFFEQPEDQCINNNNYTFIAKGDYGQGADILWVLGDDASRDSLSSPTAANIVYADTGMHIVSLFISENGCTIEYRDTFYIVLPPVASFPDLSAKQCLNINSYDFWPDGQYSSTATFQWNFGNLASPTTATTDTVLGVTFYSPGIYTITLSINDGGCTSIYQGNVEIVDAPQAFAYDQDPQCILGNSFDFKGSGLFGSSADFLWVFGPNANKDSTTSQNENGVSFDTTGIHRVYFTITENGCPDTYFLAVEVTPEPVADFTFIADQCISNGPFDFMFTGFGGQYATYQWQLPTDATILSDSTINSVSIPKVSFSNSGPHTVSLTVSENGCTDTYNQLFNLTPAPVASFQPQTPQCLDVNSFDFINTGSFGIGAIISWDFTNQGNPSTSSDSNPTEIKFLSDGPHLITLSITEFGCTDIYTDTIIVTPTPNPTFTARDPQCVDINSFNFNCLGNFTDAATFTWDFGIAATPSSSLLRNQDRVSFNAPGTYRVTIQVDEYGCSITYSDFVTVTAKPAPFFDHPSTLCVGSNWYRFLTKGSYGVDATFEWNFGTNTNQGTGIVATKDVSGVSFNTVGVHYIDLQISENGCVETYTDSVIITPSPVPFINPENDQCVNINSFDFDLTGSSYGTSAMFYWDFGPNGSPRYDSNMTPSTIVFNTVGVQTVTLTIEENGCSIVKTITVNVTAPPGASFTRNNSNQEQCISINAYDFVTSGTYGSAATFNWNFGPSATPNSASIETPPSVSFSSTGWHFISLTVTENGCPETTTDSVLITDVPTALSNPVSTQCVNDNSYDFYGLGTFGPNATFSWDFAGAASPNVINSKDALSVVFTLVGTHNVTYTVRENGCSDVFTVVVNITPAPDATFIANNQNQCITNQSFDFSIVNSSIHGPNATYSWGFGPDANMGSSNIQNPTGITFSDSGIYPVSLTISENGCIDTSLYSVSVYPLPIPSFSANQTGCAPHTVIFQNKSYAWTTMTYLWDFGDGNTSANTNPSHVYQNSGDYTVTLTAYVAGSDPCPGSYDTVMVDFITVYPSPTPGFITDRDVTTIFDPIITVANTSTDAITVEFDFDDGTLVTNPPGGTYSHSYTEYGIYNITQTVTNQYGCQNSMTIQVEIESVYRFYAPNAFTPNGDGDNDVYYQKGIGFGNGSYALHIYTRWGEKIYYSNNILVGWDGFDIKNNTPAPQGSYIYLTEITDNYGVAQKYRGTVTLMK